MTSIKFSFSKIDASLAEQLAKQINDFAADWEFTSFMVGCLYPKNISKEQLETYKKEFQFNLTKAIEQTGKKIDFEHPDLTFDIDFNWEKIFFKPRPVFVKGRYRKLKRGLPQTKYYCFKCKGDKCAQCNYKGVLADESVEELIAKTAIPFFNSERMKFHGSGREDTDVLMLGSGRPFIIEFISPQKRTPDLKELESEINNLNKNKIELFNLEYSDKKEVDPLKHANHKKIYLASIECSEKPNLSMLENHLNKEIKIVQQTPVRVVKRRADKDRLHIIILKEISGVSNNSFKLLLQATAGCYIKEFISSDANRTKPSISSLLSLSCRCTELDVMSILDE